MMGAPDSTYPGLSDLHRQDTRVRVIRLRRNFGQTAAIAAGFDAARGDIIVSDIIVSMDGDLQNDPDDIESPLKILADGYGVVSGWRVHRQEGFWLPRLPSRVANWLISRITDVHLHDDSSTLKRNRELVLGSSK